MTEMAEFSGAGADDGILVIDCETCAVRGIGCSDCVVTTLLGIGGWGDVHEGSETGVDPLDADETRALEVLAAGGLLPPLRLSPRAQTG